MKVNLKMFDDDEKKNKKQKCSIRFPWWCIYIFNGVCIILVGLSIFFIIVRGIQFGNLKVKKWLISMLTGLLASIFLTQPIQVKFPFLFC
jgi:hypothetical protein